MATNLTAPYIDWRTLSIEEKAGIRQHLRGLIGRYLGDDAPVDSMTVEVRDVSPDFRYNLEIERSCPIRRKLSITIEHR
jgi:hypothetical protein